MREAELDGKPETKEWAVVLIAEERGRDGNGVERRTAYGAVIVHDGERYAVQGFEFPEESYGNGFIAAVGDLTGDGLSDIVWGSVSIGAHTSWASYTVSTWTGDTLRELQGKAEIANATDAAVTGDGKLAITGGLIGSAGAGPWQREYTDEYAVADDALVRVNRTFSESPTSYHRMLDGLWAEALGQTDRAKRLLTEAIGMEDDSYEGYMFAFPGDDRFVEGGTDPEREGAFAAAVEGFARFRLALLTARENGAAPAAACAEAKRQAAFDPGWLPLLSSPYGYANPYWDEETACAPIDTLPF